MQLILNSTWPHVITYTNKSPVFGFSSHQGSNVRFDQIKVQWDPLPHQFANWRLRGYTIYYQESYYSYLRKSAVSTSNLYVNMVILRGLKAATRYQIAVSAFRSKGAGTQPYWHYITLWPGRSKLG